MAPTPHLNFDSNFLLFTGPGRIVVPRQIWPRANVVRDNVAWVAPVSDPGMG
jgi:hypothetical protein